MGNYLTTRPAERTATTPTFVKYEYIGEPCIMDLREMLTYRRPAGSATEHEFIKMFIEPLGPAVDNYGNQIIMVGKSEVMWSCHTDTVHHTEGIQRIKLDRDIVFTKDGGSNCLGADCTTGVWLMIEMIKAGVPGLYIFHREEEIGGGGSTYFADKHYEMAKEFKYAIAFDRKGTTSVITHQWGGRCCSAEFAKSIATMLPGKYVSDNTGTFTDTANYMDIIPECTNISVGYYNQHTRQERQDLHHAFRLRNALLKFDESQLVCKRDPSVKEVRTWTRGYSGAYGGSYGSDSYCGNEAAYRAMASYFGAYGGAEEIDEEELKAKTLEDFVRRNPKNVADLLEQYGLTVDDLYDEYPNSF